MVDLSYLRLAVKYMIVDLSYWLLQLTIASEFPQFFFGLFARHLLNADAYCCQ